MMTLARALCKYNIHLITLAAALLSSCGQMMPNDGATLTLIHVGDIHGHLMSRPHIRDDGTPREQGGVARMYTRIQDIRQRHPNHLLLNTGDTIQGSAEAMYTQGQAMVDVLNRFGFDAFAPGNWEFVYGTQRFLELFTGTGAKAPWTAIAANLYYDGAPYAAQTGKRVLPPYVVKQVGGIKVGIMGMTTDRGPQVVGRDVTQGFRFSKGDAEVRELVGTLRGTEKVDVVVMLSELGLANNIRLAEATPGIDVVLSSDMHEITSKPVITKSGTIILEEGQDGTVVGELTLRIAGGKVVAHTHTAHTISPAVPQDPAIAAAVAAVRKSFLAGPDFKKHTNPFNGAELARPIDTVVGFTQVPLHRSNFTHQNMPAVIEGSAHDFLTDAFRSQANAEIGAIRGFRYGTHVPVGPIRMEDLYHFVATGPLIAKGTIKGQQLLQQIEGAADGSLNPIVEAWTGGWLFNFSGVRMRIDPYAQTGKRASGVEVFDSVTLQWTAIDKDRDYTYASYYYKRDPDLINLLPAKNISTVLDANGKPADGVEVVVQYLQSLPDRTAKTEINRIQLLRPLPASSFGMPEVQPWRGVSAVPTNSP
jgi:S-sulfosulfanyl-L-cysteine sulfohydrolase